MTGPPPLPDRPPPPGPPPLPATAPPTEPSTEDREPAARASLHPTERTRTYPCRRCGAQLVFDIVAQLLSCPSCGNQQPIVEGVGRAVVEHGLAGIRTARARAVVQPGAEKEVVCQNCGGHTTFSGSLTATRCPYCATPIQRDDVHDAPDRLPVDAVLPFQVPEPAARAVVEKWIRSRWFAPREFTRYAQTGSFTSVYVSYFTFDAAADTDYAGERGTTYTVVVGSGDNRRTETRIRWTPVRGRVHNRFDDLPVLANTGLDETKVAELEPWPTELARPYSAEYVAGHLSRTYDRTAEQCFESARQRMEQEIDHTVRGDIGGAQQRVHHQDTRWYDLRFKYLLLPIWLLTVVHRGQPFQVCLNGVTGEVRGRRPISAVKVTFAVLVALVVVVGVLLLYRSRGG